MRKRYYDVHTLAADLRGFEERYGASSREHSVYRKWGGTKPYSREEPGGFDAGVWASFYHEHQQLSELEDVS